MKEFTCKEQNCGKTYTNPYNLKRHRVLKHLKNKIFECEVCGKQLSSNQNLKEHECKHYGQMPYQCSICFDQFRYCSQFSIHRRAHLSGIMKDSVGELRVRII